MNTRCISFAATGCVRIPQAGRIKGVAVVMDTGGAITASLGDNSVFLTDAAGGSGATGVSVLVINNSTLGQVAVFVPLNVPLRDGMVLQCGVTGTATASFVLGA